MRTLWMRSLLRAGALVCALLVAGPMMAATDPDLASADTAYRVEARLPKKLNLTSAVWTGRYAYIFGGNGSYWGPSPDILRFDPAANTVETLPVKLPFDLDSAGVVWDGDQVYIFGGRRMGARINPPSVVPSYAVLRFDPKTETVTKLAAELPLASYPTHAIWTGKTFLVFGSRPGAGMSTLANQIMSFDPTTVSTTILDSRLPLVGYPGIAGGFFDGTHAYIFSASSGDVSFISKLDPFKDTIETLDAKLPYTCYASSAWDGHDAYIFGGIPCNDPTNLPRLSRSIIRFDPQTQQVTPMRSELPSRRATTAAFSTGKEFFVIGGLTYEEPGVVLRPITVYHWWSAGVVDEIIRFAPIPAAPSDFSATNRLDGRVQLRWTPPPSNTYGWTIQYRIYRATEIGEEVVAQVPGDQTSYVDTCPIARVCRYRVSAFNNSGEGESSNYSAGVGLAP